MKNKLSEIQIVPVKPQNGLIGFASLVFENAFYFSSIGIYTRPQGGYRLTYPTRKALSTSLPIFHPINKEMTALIEQAVTAKFEQLHGNEQ